MRSVQGVARSGGFRLQNEQRRVIREAEVAKHVYTSATAETTRQQQLLLQEKEKCSKCEALKKKEAKVERILKAAEKSEENGGAGSATRELECTELKNLQNRGQW